MESAERGPAVRPLPQPDHGRRSQPIGCGSSRRSSVTCRSRARRCVMSRIAARSNLRQVMRVLAGNRLRRLDQRRIPARRRHARQLGMDADRARGVHAPALILSRTCAVISREAAARRDRRSGRRSSARRAVRARKSRTPFSTVSAAPTNEQDSACSTPASLRDRPVSFDIVDGRWHLPGRPRRRLRNACCSEVKWRRASASVSAANTFTVSIA